MKDTSREALIAKLRYAHTRRFVSGLSIFSNAADMLEADAQEIEGWKADQKENLANQVALQEQINTDDELTIAYMDGLHTGRKQEQDRIMRIVHEQANSCGKAGGCMRISINSKVRAKTETEITDFETKPDSRPQNAEPGIAHVLSSRTRKHMEK